MYRQLRQEILDDGLGIRGENKLQVCQQLLSNYCIIDHMWFASKSTAFFVLIYQHIHS